VKVEQVKMMKRGSFKAEASKRLRALRRRASITEPLRRQGIEMRASASAMKPSTRMVQGKPVVGVRRLKMMM
jgi:hypothetical protein